MSLGQPERSRGALLPLAERLLERAVSELELTDRPLARLAADRCIARLMDVCEALVASGADRTNAPRGRLHEARHALRAAHWSLALVNRQGAVLPPAYRRLSAGLDVLARRLDRMTVARRAD